MPVSSLPSWQLHCGKFLGSRLLFEFWRFRTCAECDSLNAMHLCCREADVVIIVDIAAEIDPQAHYICGLSAAAGRPVLCFVDKDAAVAALSSDARVKVQRPCASAQEYGTAIRSFIATAVR